MKVSSGTTPQGWMCASRVGLGCEGVATPQCSPPSQDFDRRVIPVCGLEEVVVDDKTRRALRDIINFEKARSELVLCVGVCAYVCVCALRVCSMVVSRIMLLSVPGLFSLASGALASVWRR